MNTKKLFFFAIAALGLAACSNDEVVETIATSEANEISFRPIVKGMTRATDIDATTLHTSGFKVFATIGNDFSSIYFNESDFTWDGSSSYTSANKYYWPSSGSLDFYAYASNGSSTITHTAQTKAFTITPAAEAANQSDFVFANTNGKSKAGTYDPADPYNSESLSKTSNYGTNGVPLNFRHALSKVTVKLKNSNTNLKVIVKKVTIGYLNTVGTYTYSGSTGGQGNTDKQNIQNLQFSDWSAQSGTGSYVQTATTTTYTSATDATALPESFILIPQTLSAATSYSAAATNSEFNGAYIKAQIKIKNVGTTETYIVGSDGDEDGNYETALWPLQAITWNPGYHYIYTVDLAGGGYFEKNHDTEQGLDPILEGAEIRFVDVTVDAWDAANYTVGNMVYAQGGSYTGNIVKETGQYTITISGLTSGETITGVTTDVGTVTPASGTAGTDGTFSFSLNAPENTTGANRTITVTVTDSNAPTTTTITLTQASS